MHNRVAATAAELIDTPFVAVALLLSLLSMPRALMDAGGQRSRRIAACDISNCFKQTAAIRVTDEVMNRADQTVTNGLFIALVSLLRDACLQRCLTMYRSDLQSELGGKIRELNTTLACLQATRSCRLFVFSSEECRLCQS